MAMPDPGPEGRRRPLCYDPQREKYILYDEIVAGAEKIIPVEHLSESDLKKLVIKRWSVLPAGKTVQSISGPPYSRDDVIRAIERDEPFGKMTVQAEKSMIHDLLEEIERNL